MSRNKRANSSLQTIAVLSVSVLFVLTALVGLYKCFSKPPEPSGGALRQAAGVRDPYRCAPARAL